MQPPQLLSFLMVAIVGWPALADEPGKVAKPVDRLGDEIIVCGQRFHTSAPVVTWMDPDGYDAYRPERRFSKVADRKDETSKKKNEAARTPNRFGARRLDLSPIELERVRTLGIDLPTLQANVDQFVIHFDVCGTSKKCFEVLHDERNLSVHFLLDIDGTIYQTLDLKERAYHATKANDRSIGIEIANIGTFPPREKDSPRVKSWYRTDPDGQSRITVPTPGMLPSRSANLVLRPDRNKPIVGVVQGEEYAMYDLTPQQYDSLIKLTAALCKTFPKIRCDYPRDLDGKLTPRKLPDLDYTRYQGILGHYHVQANKNDPGPALQWDRLIDESRKLIAK